MNRDIGDDRKGVAGFFLDVPILLLMIVTITVFLALFSRAYLVHQSEVNKEEQDQVCLTIKRKIQVYPEMMKEDEGGIQQGPFAIEKLNVLSNETLDTYLGVEDKYLYNIMIETTRENETWVFGKDHDGSTEEQKMSSYQVPVTLIDEDGRSHLGRFRVTVWKR
ncbi:MAG: hypothetical protein KGY76_05275 [Candidatus Thermoplasmatota archaeon]|nr:hypothetical protein [Candidatus Thermoplasmatota archaeon]